MHDLSNVVAYYERLIDEASDDRQAVGWRTSYAQDTSFLALSRVEGLSDGARVLDVGCGLGALKDFFDRAGPKVDYTGYDIVPKMIERAAERHPGVKFEVRDILRDPPRGRFDFVFSSGVLATSAMIADHDRFVADMIRAMYRLTHVALAFNMPSAWAYMGSAVLQRDATAINFAWPEQIFRLCKGLSRQVSLIHDAQRGTFTMFVYRNNRGALARYLEYLRPGSKYDSVVEKAIHYHIELGLYLELREFLLGLEPCAAVLNHLGQTEVALGRRDLAVPAFQQAMVADPTQPWPYLNLGHLARGDHRPQAALAAYQRAIEVAPGCAEAHEALVRALIAFGRRAEARAALAAMPEGALASYLSGALADDEQEALAAYERALQAAPNYVDALLAAAKLNEARGAHSHALALLRRAQQIDPTDRRLKQRVESLVFALASNG